MSRSAVQIEHDVLISSGLDRALNQCVRVRYQPDQRAGMDRHTEPGYLLTGSRPGHSPPAANVGAAGLLLPLIKVAPECAVNSLDAGAIYECMTVTLDTVTNQHIRRDNDVSQT